MEKYRPGEIVPKPCNYHVFDKNGKDGGLLFLDKGDKFPATEFSGSYYVMSKNCSK